MSSDSKDVRDFLATIPATLRHPADDPLRSLRRAELSFSGFPWRGCSPWTIHWGGALTWLTTLATTEPSRAMPDSKNRSQTTSTDILNESAALLRAVERFFESGSGSESWGVYTAKTQSLSSAAIPRWTFRVSSDPRRQASQGPESIDVGDQSRTLCCRR
jgi:hypothetical protein